MYIYIYIYIYSHIAEIFFDKDTKYIKFYEDPPIEQKKIIRQCVNIYIYIYTCIFMKNSYTQSENAYMCYAIAEDILPVQDIGFVKKITAYTN